jgi:hypothetical protein
MGTSFRVLAIVVELVILMAVIYSLFLGVKLAIFDLGLDKKYKTFIRLVLTIIGSLALIFFTAHLIAFYPLISP